MLGSRQGDTGWLAIMRDITRRKRGQQALERAFSESQQHADETMSYLTATRAILEVNELPEALSAILQSCSTIVNAPDGFVALCDAEGEQCNIVVLRKGGVSRIAEEAAMPVCQLGRLAIKTQNPVYDNSFIQTNTTDEKPEGHLIIETVLFAPIIVEQQVLGLLVLANKPEGFTDDDVDYTTGLAGVASLAISHFRNREKINDAYKQERELRATLEQEIHKRVDFTRALVHELKTPLTPIMATTEILLAGLKDERWNKMVKNIQRGGENLKQRIDDLLDLVRGELGMLTIQREQVAPLSLLRDIAREMDYIVSARHQDILLELPEQMPDIPVDEIRLRQVITNLLNNASKFSPDGSHITLRARADDNNIIIEVEDKGIGITEEAMKTLFTPYERTGAEHERFSGLGLGLALSKSIIEMHGGQIWVKSKKGQGSTFSFSLPYVVDPDNSVAKND